MYYMCSIYYKEARVISTSLVSEKAKATVEKISPASMHASFKSHDSLSEYRLLSGFRAHSLLRSNDGNVMRL